MLLYVSIHIFAFVVAIVSPGNQNIFICINIYNIYLTVEGKLFQK